MELLSILNRLSFAKSVVGLTGKPLVVTMDLPLYFPPIIRTGVGVKVCSVRVPRVNLYLDLK